MTVPFRNQILDAKDLEKNENDNEKMLFNLQKLFLRMMSNAHSGKAERINPRFFKETVPEPFRSSVGQQDTMEFGLVLLDDIEKKTKDTPLSKLVKEMFTLEIVHRYTCQDCQSTSLNNEENLHIPLTFSNNYSLIN